MHQLFQSHFSLIKFSNLTNALFFPHNAAVLQCCHCLSLPATYFTSLRLLSLIPLLHPSPLPPPLDILSHYKAWFGSLVCVHVVPLCKRPRLKLCGKSSASFLNTPSITVQGLWREGGRFRGKELREVSSSEGRGKSPLKRGRGGP